MMRFLKEISVSLLFSILLFFVLKGFILHRVDSQLKGVVIENSDLVSIDSSKVKNLIGDKMDFIDIDLQAVADSAIEVIKARSVSLHRRLDKKVGMSVKAEKPILWVKSDGIYALSSTGRILSLSDVPNESDFPVFISSHPLKMEKGGLCDDLELLYVVGFLNELDSIDTHFAEIISTIKVDKDRGIIITLIPNEIPVIVGFNDYEYRINKIKSVYNYLSGIKRKPAFADARYGDIIQIKYLNRSRRVG